jgi:hypothetical protein
MLEYIALGILLMALLVVFYVFVYLHDLPYAIAKERNHPHTEAIHAACWLSLFTLHAIWPIVFIWAVSKPKQVEVVVKDEEGADLHLGRRLAALEERLGRLESGDEPEAGAPPHAADAPGRVASLEHGTK